MPTSTVPYAGHRPPKRITEGTIRCDCAGGYEGPPLEPIVRWPEGQDLGELSGEWQGACPHGSHRIIEPKGAS